MADQTINNEVKEAAPQQGDQAPRPQKDKYAKSYVIVSGKGGVGKTTVCANLGMALSLLGRKVLLVDADIGLKNLDVSMGLEERCVHDIVDCVSGRVRFAAAAVQDPRVSSLSLISASQNADKNALTPRQMAEFCHELMKDFDYILIDAPAGIENGFMCAVAPATHALVVVTPDHLSVRNADRIAGLLEAQGLLQKNIGVIVNKIEAHLVSDSMALDVEEIKQTLGLPMIGEIPFDYDVTASNFRKRPVVLNGRSHVASIILNIAKAIDGEKVKPIHVKKLTFWDRLVNSLTPHSR